MCPQKFVQIVEVGPRDGLQNEAKVVSVAERISFIQSLGKVGLRTIEAGSFISPKWVPQMADTAAVLTGLDLMDNINYPVLVPNKRGMEDAIAAGAREVAVFAAASETFSQKNINCTIEQSIERFSEVIELATQHGIAVRGYVSCVLGCPYEGAIDQVVVTQIAKQLYTLGCYQISLGDTIGVGTPTQTQSLITLVSKEVPLERIAVHFHDSYGQALANILMALQMGIRVVDSSVAGLGGCPYAAGSSGNVATEDVVYMLHGMNFETGINLDQLITVGCTICEIMDTPVRSKVNQARSASLAT